ncbi:MAG: GNAT family N-acetyltransferase [Anaerovoracaceae bacterium]
MITYSDKIKVEEYNGLRRAVGWEPLEETQAMRGIANSAFVIVAYDGERAVGLTRVISDGGYANLIADVMVQPEYQGQQIGKYMVTAAVDYLRTTINEEQFLMINIMASKGKEDFYEKLGFTKRPNETMGSGLVMWLNKPR